MGGRVHLASLTRFWLSGVPQLPSSTLDRHLSSDDTSGVTQNRPMRVTSKPANESKSLGR